MALWFLLNWARVCVGAYAQRARQWRDRRTHAAHWFRGWKCLCRRCERHREAGGFSGCNYPHGPNHKGCPYTVWCSCKREPVTESARRPNGK